MQTIVEGFRMLAGLVTLTVAMMVGIGDANAGQTQAQVVPALGRHTVGSTLAEVRMLRRSENCLIEADHADCTFTDADGVSYTVLEDSVIAATVVERTAKPGIVLPFGLEFGDTVDAAVRMLVANGRTWIVGKDPDVPMDVVFSSQEKFVGNNGWDFNIEVRFSSGRLVSVSYNAGTL